MSGIWRWKTAQYAERKWWSSYLRNKNVDEYLIWKKAYWNRLLSKCNHYIILKKEYKILDAGCGPSGIFINFPDHEVTAFDPLIEQYEHDLPHFKKARYPNVEFVKAGLEDFSSDHKFDVVFCMNAINHVQDIQKSFDKLVSFAKPASFIIITIDAHTHSIFKKIFRLIPGDILHPHQYDMNEYQNMLTKRGCKILGTELLKHTFLFDHYMLIASKA